MTDCNCPSTPTPDQSCTGATLLPQQYQVPNMPCAPLFDLVNCNDNLLSQMYVNEQLTIAAAPINVYKLLGIKEFTKTVDLLSTGNPIASGEFVDYPAANAFDTLTTEWRSPERGQQVTCHAYIGYDFGLKRLANDRLVYPNETGEVRQLITSIVIQQAGTDNNKVTKARIERSDDGVRWFGVSIINLPPDNGCHRHNIKKTAASRFWRIVPITFTGGDLDSWHVTSIELLDAASAELTDVQIDYGLMENIDRSYSRCPVSFKALVTGADARTELSKFGLQLPELNETTIKSAFITTVGALGRPFVIGDIIEIPHQGQYDVNLKLVRRYVEVVDVSWDSTSYTAGWYPTVQLVTCQPALASHETKDIFDDLHPPASTNKYKNLEDPKINLEAFDIDANIKSQADADVPQAGSDVANLRHISTDEVKSAAEHRIDISGLDATAGIPGYVEDGMPPNGDPFTQGEVFPSNPADRQYHRLTYPEGTGIPVRLHRYSSAKSRWIFIEEDKRGKHSIIQQKTNGFLLDESATSPAKIGKQ